MRKPIKHRLQIKGWAKDEIQKVESIFSKKSLKSKIIEELIYFLMLGVSIISSGIVAIILIPFLITLKNNYVYPITAIIGFSFGALIFFVLKSIDFSKSHHHFAGIFILITSYLISYTIVQFSNQISLLFGFGLLVHNRMIIAGIYAISFVLPFFIDYEVYEKLGKHKDM